MEKALGEKIKSSSITRPSSWQKHQKLSAGILIVIFAAIGTYLLAFSHAANTYGPIVGVNHYCLDDWGDTKADFNKIDLWWCNGTPAQQWVYNPANESFTNANGYCLDDGYDHNYAGAIINLYQCNSTDAQHWVVNATAGTIMHHNLCLDVQYEQANPGNHLILNNCNGTAYQHWTVTAGTSTAPTQIAPQITSASSATFTGGQSGSFTVTDTGTPTPTLSESGALPSGISFNTSTGVLSGSASSVGTYTFTFSASNGVSPNAVQTFTLTVNAPPSTGSGGSGSAGSGSGGSGSGGSGSSSGGGAGTVASLIPASLFNQNVSGYPVDPNSAEFVSDVNAQWKANYNNFGVADNDPIYIVPANTAEYSISPASGCGNFTSSTGTQIPIPSYVSASSGSDLPMFLVDPSLNKIWEFWEFNKSGSGYTACWGGGSTLSTFSGIFANPYGESATGISYAATAITESDIKSGAIDHTMAMTLVDCNSSVYPADRTDCGSVSGQPGEGQMFRFASSVNCASYAATTFEHMVCVAGQNYGFVVTDKSGAVELSAEQPSDWAEEGNSGTDPISVSWAGQQEYTVVASLPWSQLQAIDPPH